MKYSKQIYLGTNPHTGKLIRKWVHADSMTELNSRIEKLKREFELTPNVSNITFKKYAEQWLSAYKSKRAGKTREMYESAIKKCQNISHIPLKSVTKTSCQQILNEQWEHPRTAKIVRDTMNQIFKAAIADGMIARNPAEGLIVPEHQTHEKHLLTDKELKAVKKADLDPKDRLFVDLLQVFGLRPAEALALRPSDFDFKKKLLKIDKAIEMTNDNKSRLKSTKTGKARNIPIPDKIIPRLKKEFKANPSFFLFTKQDNGLMTKSAYRRMTERILSRINIALGGKEDLKLTSGITMYSFRHRRASDLYYLCQKGIISTKYAAEILGHQEEIFLKIYSHVDDSKEKKDKIYPGLSSVINL